MSIIVLRIDNKIRHTRISVFEPGNPTPTTIIRTGDESDSLATKVLAIVTGEIKKES